MARAQNASVIRLENFWNKTISTIETERLVNEFYESDDDQKFDILRIMDQDKKLMFAMAWSYDAWWRLVIFGPDPDSLYDVASGFQVWNDEWFHPKDSRPYRDFSGGYLSSSGWNITNRAPKKAAGCKVVRVLVEQDALTCNWVYPGGYGVEGYGYVPKEARAPVVWYTVALELNCNPISSWLTIGYNRKKQSWDWQVRKAMPAGNFIEF